MSLIYRYKKPALTSAKEDELLAFARQNISPDILDIKTEYCFYIESKGPLSAKEDELLLWLLSETFEPENFSTDSFLTNHESQITNHGIIEVGPRMNFTTAWSSNAVSVCHACGLSKITRIERSRRFKLETTSSMTEGAGR